MISVRPFDPDDLPALWALAHLPDSGITEDPSVPVPLPPRRVPPAGPADLVDPAGTVLADGGHLLVAVDEGQHLVGVGGLRGVHARPHLGRLIRLRVHPAVRRRGVGRALMSALEEVARQQGYSDLMLDVGDHQPEALAFYRALGWSETWREAGPEWHWQTVWFHRSLDRAHLRVEVRACASDADADAAEQALPSRGRRTHHRRWAAQQAGEGTYLLAWHGSLVVGHVILRHTSRFPEVSEAMAGEHPELLRLAVAPHALRRGVATALLGAAAGLAREQHDVRLLGLAIPDENEAALVLCRRLGWVRSPGLSLVDAWTWTDERGREHEEEDVCGYWTLTLPEHRVHAAE